MLKNWREQKIGNKVRYTWNEFDGCGSEVCEVTSVDDVRLIASHNGLNYWCDDDTMEMFEEYVEGGA